MKNLNHAGDRKFIDVYLCQNYQNKESFEKATAKKMVQFMPHVVLLTIYRFGHTARMFLPDGY